MLVELIAVHGVGREPGEVVPQVHRFFDEVGIRLPQSGIIGLRKSGGKHEAAGITAIGRVDFAEQPNLAGGNGPQRYLIG